MWKNHILRYTDFLLCFSLVYLDVRYLLLAFQPRTVDISSPRMSGMIYVLSKVHPNLHKWTLHKYYMIRLEQVTTIMHEQSLPSGLKNSFAQPKYSHRQPCTAFSWSTSQGKTLKHQTTQPLTVHITFPSNHHLLGKSDHSTIPKSCHSMIKLHPLHVKSPHSNFELLIPHCPYQSYYQSPPFPQPLGCVFHTFLSNTHSIFRNQPTLQLISLILLRNHPIFTAPWLCPL